MDDRRGIPSDFFSSADVLRLFGFLSPNVHNFQNNCQKLFSIDTSTFYFIEESARGSLLPQKLKWASDYHKQYIFFFINSTLKRQVLKLIY